MSHEKQNPSWPKLTNEQRSGFMAIHDNLLWLVGNLRETSDWGKAENLLGLFIYYGLQMVKNLPAMQETWVRSLGREGNGNPVQYSCLGNSMDRGAWWATVHGIAKSQTWLINQDFLYIIVISGWGTRVEYRLDQRIEHFGVTKPCLQGRWWITSLKPRRGSICRVLVALQKVECMFSLF